MEGRNFVQTLKNIKAEVLAMKQGHRYGIGRADFSNIVVSATNGSARLTVEFTNPPEKMPLVQIYGFAPTSAPTYDGGVYTISGNSTDSVRTIASTLISSATVEAV